MSWRFFATRLNGDGTEEFIAPDIEINNPVINYELSAPNGMDFTITPEIDRLIGKDGNPIFVPWSTAIYAEHGGVIRYGGIVTDVAANDFDLSITTEGFLAYAYGMPYMAYRRWVDVDPIWVAQHIWETLSNWQGGDLGLVFRGDLSSPTRIGEEEDNSAGTSDGPFELTWYGTHDLGAVFDDMAEAAPFDYIERHAWSRETIKHFVDIGYPTLGRRRRDLRFAIGENVQVIPTVESNGDDYASHVVFLGAGEGRNMVRGDAVDPAPRLRRVQVVTDKTVKSPKRADNLARGSLNRAHGDERVNAITVINHPHAPIGSYDVGDEIYVQGDTGWTGSFNRWVRIISISLDTNNDVSTLSLEPIN